MKSYPFRVVDGASITWIAAATTLIATACTHIPNPDGTSGSSTGESSSSSSSSSGTGGSGGIPFAGGLLVQGSTVNGNLGLYRFSLDGTWSTRIANTRGNVYLSANRSRIATWRTLDGLIFLDPDGNNVATLDLPNVLTWSFNAYVSISPTGKYIAYFMDAIEPEKSIYVAPTDGTGGDLLLTGKQGFWEWSPVDDKLAFGGEGAPLRIYDADTKTSIEATNSLQVPKTWGKAWWTPDGQRLAFIESLPNEIVIASVDKQGQDRRLLLSNLSNFLPYHYGQWSPDGQYFALWQFVSSGSSLQIRLVDANGAMSRDIMDDAGVEFNGWTPTNHFVYQKIDGSIKSIPLSGATLDLVGPPNMYSRTTWIGRTGRVMYSDGGQTVGTIGADGSIPIVYPEKAFIQSVQLSYDGSMLALAPFYYNTPETVPIYAASSDNAQMTLVTTLTNQLGSTDFNRIERSSGLVFSGWNSAGWILPTSEGFKAIYPQPALDRIHWAASLE